MPENFDEFHTIEFNGPKGWEVFQTHSPRHISLDAVTTIFLDICRKNSDMQWRLVTAKP